VLTKKLLDAGFEYYPESKQDNLVGVAAHSIKLKKLFFNYLSE